MSSLQRLGPGLALALLLGAAPARALDVVLDYRYDESGFFDDPERRAVLEHAVRLYTRAIDAELGAMPEGEWAAVFPDPGRAERVVYRALDVERSTLHVFVGARPRGAADPARGAPGYAAWHCDDPRAPADCAALAARETREVQRAWLERFVFRSRPAAAAWPPRAFAPWGGSLSFASDVDWHVGIHGPVPSAKLDLLSAAVRELGPIFGVGTAGSWGMRTGRGCFEGARVHSEAGSCLALDAKRDRLAAPVAGRLAGGLQSAAFAAGLQAGERRLLTALDEAVLGDLGWERRRPEDEGGARVVIKGDLDGDARVDGRDLLLLGNPAALSDEQRLAGDVAPMIEGEAVGDGQLDASDLAVLRAALEHRDIDGDGIPTMVENALNGASAAVAGSLVHHPLQRWPDACAGAFAAAVPFFGPTSRTVPFCGRDGGAWFELPSIAFPPPVIVLPQGFDIASSDQRSPSAERLALSMWVTLRSWSPRPDVSPELYLDLVRDGETGPALLRSEAQPASELAAEQASTAARPTRTGAAAAPHGAEIPLHPPPPAEVVGSSRASAPASLEPDPAEPETLAAPPAPPHSRRAETASSELAPIESESQPPPHTNTPEAELQTRVTPRGEIRMAQGETPVPQRDLIRELLDALAALWARLKAAFGHEGAGWLTNSSE
jgi:hypothetical protein